MKPPQWGLSVQRFGAATYDLRPLQLPAHHLVRGYTHFAIVAFCQVDCPGWSLPLGRCKSRFRIGWNRMCQSLQIMVSRHGLACGAPGKARPHPADWRSPGDALQALSNIQAQHKLAKLSQRQTSVRSIVWSAPFCDQGVPAATLQWCEACAQPCAVAWLAPGRTPALFHALAHACVRGYPSWCSLCTCSGAHPPFVGACKTPPVAFHIGT